MDTSTSLPNDSSSTATPELQALLNRLDTILPNSKERSVTSVELYLDGSKEERLMITGLRFPSGSLGQIRFDYRAATGSSLIDLDTETATMQGYDMAPQAAASSSSRHVLDVASTATWLDGLIARGSVQSLENR